MAVSNKSSEIFWMYVKISSKCAHDSLSHKLLAKVEKYLLRSLAKWLYQFQFGSLSENQYDTIRQLFTSISHFVKIIMMIIATIYIVEWVSACVISNNSEDDEQQACEFKKQCIYCYNYMLKNILIL